MHPDQQRQWDDWVRAHIANALAEHRELLTEAMGEALSTIRKQLRDEFAAEIAALRLHLTVQTSIARGEIAQIGKTNAA